MMLHLVDFSGEGTSEQTRVFYKSTHHMLTGPLPSDKMAKGILVRSSATECHKNSQTTALRAQPHLNADNHWKRLVPSPGCRNAVRYAEKGTHPDTSARHILKDLYLLRHNKKLWISYYPGPT